MKKNLKTIFNKNAILKKKKNNFFKFLQEETRRLQKQQAIKKIRRKRESKILNLKAFKRQVNKGYYKGIAGIEVSKRLDFTLIDVRLRGYDGEDEEKVAFEKGIELKRLWDPTYWAPYYTWRRLVLHLDYTSMTMECIEYQPYLKKIEGDNVEEDEYGYLEPDEFTKRDRRVHELTIFTFLGDLEKMQKKKKKKKGDHLITETYRLLNKYEIRFEVEMSATGVEFEIMDRDDFGGNYRCSATEDINHELALQAKLFENSFLTGLLIYRKKKIFLSSGVYYNDISRRVIMNTPEAFLDNKLITFKKTEKDLFLKEEEEPIKGILKKIIHSTSAEAANSAKERYKKRIIEVNGKLYNDYLFTLNNLKKTTEDFEGKESKHYQVRQFVDYATILFLICSTKATILYLQYKRRIGPRDTDLIATCANYFDMYKEYFMHRNTVLQANYLQENINKLFRPETSKLITFNYEKKGHIYTIANETNEIWKVLQFTESIPNNSIMKDNIIANIKLYISCGEYLNTLGINLLDSFF